MFFETIKTKKIKVAIFSISFCEPFYDFFFIVIVPFFFTMQLYFSDWTFFSKLNFNKLFPTEPCCDRYYMSNPLGSIHHPFRQCSVPSYNNKTHLLQSCFHIKSLTCLCLDILCSINRVHRPSFWKVRITKQPICSDHRKVVTFTLVFHQLLWPSLTKAVKPESQLC